MPFGGWLDFAGGRIESYFALVFGCIGLFVVLYSIGKVRGPAGRVAEYFVFLLLLVGSGLAVTFGRNLLVIFAAWELATFALWRLVAFYRGDDDLNAAGWAWYVNFLAATLMLVGLAMLLTQYGSLDLDALARKPFTLVPAALLLIGILAKSAVLPLYVWLPRAYRAAPAGICALLSGVAENLGVILFLKLFVLTMSVPAQFMTFVAGLAVISSLVAGGLALGAGTVRTTLAYSTISQLGFIFLGVAVAGYYGLLGGLLYVAAHAVAKAGLFFSAGLVEDAAGTDEFDRLGGVARRAPVLAAAAAMLALSVMGIPPFFGFFAKLAVVVGTVRQNLLLGVGALVAALFTVLYLGRLYMRVFLGSGTAGEWKPVSPGLVALVAVTAVISLAAGVLYYLPVRFLEGSVMALVGFR